MELEKALSQIAEIRQQVAQTEIFRGYRALPVLFSGLLAFATAVVQPLWIPEPARDVGAFLLLWIACAGLSVAAIGCEMTLRMRRTTSALEHERVLMAVGHFLPPLLAGALVMLVIVRFAPEAVWMLPGLWAIFFGLGIFASWRFLPPAIVWVGAYYLAGGLLSLAWAQGDSALSPWSMALPFGIGQLLTAAVLYWTLERP
jgi:hypothetical protein